MLVEMNGVTKLSIDTIDRYSAALREAAGADGIPGFSPSVTPPPPGMEWQPTVDVVTADAVTDEKKGSYYPATLTLHAKDMLIDGKRVRLSPGINLTAEIKTGQRRVIEYLLSSVQRAGSESLRER